MPSSFILESLKGLHSGDTLNTEGASSAANVDFDIGGIMRARPGRSYYSSADSGGAYTGTVYRLIDGGAIATGAKYVLSTTKLYEVKPAAIASASVTPDTGVPVDVIIFGTPSTGSRVYLSDSNGLRRYSGGSFTDIGATVTPRGGFLAIQSRDARLVCAYSAINAAPVSSRVHFSDAGAPETWTSTNFVDLNPGDGEVITGMQTLGDLVVVFKETRAYVFYGNSVSGTGTPVFNYRTVNLGDRIVPGSYSGRFGSDGRAIYFAAARGVYQMSGDSPQLISGAITQYLSAGFSGSMFTFATAEKLYVGLVDTNVLLVRNNLVNEWGTYSTIQANAVADAFVPGGAYVYDSLVGRLTTLDSTVITDLGADLTSTYTSHYYDCGNWEQKRISDVWVQGSWSNSATLVIYSDGIAVATVTLPPSALNVPVRASVAAQGFTFAFSLVFTGGDSFIHRAGFVVADSRQR